MGSGQLTLYIHFLKFSIFISFVFTGELIKLLDKIASLSKSSSQRKQASDSLQETITLVQFANDECDYGMGLELGIDLFCHGDQHHDAVSHLLPLAYELLGREQYGKIITEHLKNRQRLPLDFSV